MEKKCYRGKYLVEGTAIPLRDSPEFQLMRTSRTPRAMRKSFGTTPAKRLASKVKTIA
jgi:hypothetical protein